MANRDDHLDRTSGDLGDRTERAADNAFRVRHDEPATTGDRDGEAAGGVAGAATGAALGSLGGPIGTVIGGIAGAVGGWWTGRAVSEAASSFDQDEDYYRTQYSSRQGSSGAASTSGSSDRSYDDVRPAYAVGHVAGMNPDYQNRQFDDVESDLERGWTSSDARKHGDWSDVRHYARDAYDRGRQRMTLSEEQLSIGKRQVQAGEVGLHKTVETEHVRESVPLSHDEVSVERRPLSGAEAANARIGEDAEIRVPVMREEAVVDKRAVAKEEVLVRKRAVTENQTVEADLRRERVDIDRGTATSGTTGTLGAAGLGGSTGSSTGSAGHTGGGIGDKIRHAVDDVKDRVDGNPASKPGPDATDRR